MPIRERDCDVCPRPCPAPTGPALCQTTEAPACSPGYLGASLSVGPGIGFGIEGGKVIGVSDFASWSLDTSLTYHDLYSEIETIDEVEGGKFTQARLGVKASTNPCGRGHFTGRAGVTWWQANGNPQDVDWSEIDRVGDYLGGYAAIGYEFDLGRHWTTGPEIGAAAGVHVDSGEFAWTPQARWHFIYNF